MTFFPALPYTPHFVEVCSFRFVQINLSSSLFSASLFIINRSKTFINVYKLYFVLVHNVYIALHENVELVLVLSSVFCYPLRFLENRAYNGASVG